nr:hypothetical protein HAGR004_25270 [Bdellovibrio sp. HAGR004]
MNAGDYENVLARQVHDCVCVRERSFPQNRVPYFHSRVRLVPQDVDGALRSKQTHRLRKENQGHQKK